METFQKVVSFLAGLLILIGALADECPRVPAAIVGLLLMGIFSVPEVFEFIKGKFNLREEDE